MDNIIKNLSKLTTFVIAFFVAAYFYFTYKGFMIDENGQIVLRTQIAAAAEKHGIATVLPDNLHLNASEKYAEGSLGAPLTLYEFSSLGCPHCADFHLDVIPELKKEYVEKGLLRIIFVNFPLDKKSMEAAMVLQCASVDNYQGLLSRLFDKQRFGICPAILTSCITMPQNSGLVTAKPKHAFIMMLWRSQLYLIVNKDLNSLA